MEIGGNIISPHTHKNVLPSYLVSLKYLTRSHPARWREISEFPRKNQNI